MSNASQKKRKATGPKVSPFYLALLIALGVVIIAYLFWFVRVIPLVTIPLILVLALCLLAPDLNSRYLAAIGAASAFTGVITAGFLFSQGNLEYFLRQWPQVERDVFPDVFQKTVLHMPFNLPFIESDMVLGLALVTAI